MGSLPQKEHVAFNASMEPLLSKNQRLLMKWHNRLSHLSFNKIQELARQGKLPKQIAKCDHPICISCQLGKAHRRPIPNVNKARPIDAEELIPGDKVSEDQIESPAPGMVDTYSGLPVTARYHAASLYTERCQQIHVYYMSLFHRWS